MCITALMGSVVLGMVLSTTVVIMRRQRLFEWSSFDAGQGRKPFKTFKFKPIRTSCSAIASSSEDGEMASIPKNGADLLDVLRGGSDFWRNATVVTVGYTWGLAGLSEAEFLENHCDFDDLKRLANPLKKVERRRAENCRIGRAGSAAGNGAACYAGVYAHKINGEVVDARPAPDGYFSPDGFDCIVRCPAGAYCPRSLPSKPNRTDFKQCEFPGNVDVDLIAVTYDETRFCPGSRAVNLCPEGYRCKWAEARVKCDRGYVCPRGSASQRRCHGIFGGTGFLARPNHICSTTGTAYPDYRRPLAVFVVVFALLAVIALTASGTAARVTNDLRRYLRSATSDVSFFSRKYTTSEEESPSTGDERRFFHGRFSPRRKTGSTAPRTTTLATGTRRWTLERHWHRRLLAVVVGDADGLVYAGQSPLTVSRSAVYGALIFFLSWAILWHIPTTFLIGELIVVISFFFMIFGCCGLCFFDLMHAIDSYTETIRTTLDDDDDDVHEGTGRGPNDGVVGNGTDQVEHEERYAISIDDVFHEAEHAVVLTACGCRKRANVIVASLAFVFVLVTFPTWFFLLEDGTFSITIFAMIVVVVAGAGALCLSVPYGYRPTRLCGEDPGVDEAEFRRRVDEIKLQRRRDAEDHRRPELAHVRRSNTSVEDIGSQQVELRIDLAFQNLCLRLRSNQCRNQA